VKTNPILSANANANAPWEIYVKAEAMKKQTLQLFNELNRGPVVLIPRLAMPRARAFSSG
jgi:hypothetical protein